MAFLNDSFSSWGWALDEYIENFESKEDELAALMEEFRHGLELPAVRNQLPVSPASSCATWRSQQSPKPTLKSDTCVVDIHRVAGLIERIECALNQQTEIQAKDSQTSRSDDDHQTEIQAKDVQTPRSDDDNNAPRCSMVAHSSSLVLRNREGRCRRADAARSPQKPPVVSQPQITLTVATRHGGACCNGGAVMRKDVPTLSLGREIATTLYSRPAPRRLSLLSPCGRAFSSIRDGASHNRQSFWDTHLAISTTNVLRETNNSTYRVATDTTETLTETTDARLLIRSITRKRRRTRTRTRTNDFFPRQILHAGLPEDLLDTRAE